jgi:hypothetical protein
MLSNVPGPARPQHFSGAALKDMYYYLFSPIGVYCGMLSYAGNVRARLRAAPPPCAPLSGRAGDRTVDCCLKRLVAGYK